MSEEINRGVLARQVLDNPIYKEAMVAIKAQLFERFQSTKFKHHEERDEIWRKMQTINYLESYIEEVMETGEIAQETLRMKGKRIIGL